MGLCAVVCLWAPQELPCPPLTSPQTFVSELPLSSASGIPSQSSFWGFRFSLSLSLSSSIIFISSSAISFSPSFLPQFLQFCFLVLSFSRERISFSFLEGFSPCVPSFSGSFSASFLVTAARAVSRHGGDLLGYLCPPLYFFLYWCRTEGNL